MKPRDATANRVRETLEREGQKFLQRIFDVAYMILGDRIFADEVAQETLARGVEHAAEHRGGDDVFPWLYSITVNLCREKIRSDRRRPVSCDPEKLNARPSRSHGPATSTILREEREKMATAIAGLSPAHREVFILHYVERLPFATVANICGISANAAAMRASRARRMLIEEFPEFVRLLVPSVRERLERGGAP